MTLRAVMPALALLAGLGVHGAAHAQVWERLAGHWQGTGEVSGMAATLTLAFAPALGGRAHRLSFDNRMRGADGREWPFAAEAVYLCDGEAACKGHWYDTRGTILPLATREEADALVVDWGDAASERGRTTYRLDADALEVTDEVLGKDGRWTVFGRSRLARAAD